MKARGSLHAPQHTHSTEGCCLGPQRLDFTWDSMPLFLSGPRPHSSALLCSASVGQYGHSCLVGEGTKHP